MKQILVSWSAAYDNLLHFDGNFKEQFASWSLENTINMSVLCDSFEKNHWGTGANIAYNLALLWECPILLSSIWDDYIFSDVIREKVNLNYIHKEQFEHSSSSMILSDNQDNRITVFHPWAMKHAARSKISYVEEKIWIAIVSANDISTMLEHARDLKQKSVKIFIDPAQQISQMSWDQLRELVDLWDYLIVNHYEFADLQSRWSMSEEDLQNQLEIIIVTYGEQGSHIFSWGEMINIPAISVSEIDDTTWAGDAYRAGVLFSMIEGRDIKTACQLWTVLASYSVIAPGSQQHHFSLWGVMEDMKHHFSVEIDLYQKRKY